MVWIYVCPSFLVSLRMCLLVFLCVCSPVSTYREIFYILSLGERDLTPLRELKFYHKLLTHTHTLCNHIQRDRVGKITHIRYFDAETERFLPKISSATLPLSR